MNFVVRDNMFKLRFGTLDTWCFEPEETIIVNRKVINARFECFEVKHRQSGRFLDHFTEKTSDPIEHGRI